MKLAIGLLLISYGFPLTQVVTHLPLSNRSPSATTRLAILPTSIEPNCRSTPSISAGFAVKCASA